MIQGFVAFTTALAALEIVQAFLVSSEFRYISSFNKIKRIEFITQLASSHHLQGKAQNLQDVSTQNPTDIDREQVRKLGSQELLMLPRQYGPHLEVMKTPFPQMNHICAVTLSATPSLSALQSALNEAMETHPLLRCFVKGDGEPERRIDLLQMVRQGEPSPLTFVAPPPSGKMNDHRNVLTILDRLVNDTDISHHSKILRESWENSFRQGIDNGTWCNIAEGPLWKLEFHRLIYAKAGVFDPNLPCALVLAFNHAISDQTSVNILLDQLLSDLVHLEQTGRVQNPAIRQNIPMSMEESILGVNQTWSDIQAKNVSLDTLQYIGGKATEGLKSPVILPDDSMISEGNENNVLQALTIIGGKSPGGESKNSIARKSAITFRKLSKARTEALLHKCRAHGVTMSNALSAAIAFTSSDFINGGGDSQKERTYKILHSLDMRRFGMDMSKYDSFRCMAGSHDLILGPILDNQGKAIRRNKDSEDLLFWTLAKESQAQTKTFIESRGPEHAIRVFDFAMSVADLNNLIHLTAQSTATLGRAYSAGIVNVGVFEKQKAVRRRQSVDSLNIQISHGRYNIEEIYFATSHARTGSLYQASCITVSGELQCTFHPASPPISEETNNQFADSFIDLLSAVAGAKENDAKESSNIQNPTPFRLPRNGLTYLAAAYGLGSIADHGRAWSNFFSSVLQMKDAVSSEDFWSALNFWIFFAVGHPLLQPILSISEVLHGTPGPKVGDLIPVLFLLGNVFAIMLVTLSKEIRNAVNVFALSAFLSYVGAGLDGKAGLGDFNLGLDDSYKGHQVRGCPTYEQVRQPSMDGFDIAKYQGKWYEQKFHDWTQFKEVYDTSLDIKV